MEETQLFNFAGCDVRVMRDEKGDPWFLASNITDVLGYSSGRKSIDAHCKSEGVSKRDTLTSGGIQKMTWINEPNLYRLIIKSPKPEAEPFENWVVEKVLPSIRKHGGYLTLAKTEDFINNPDLLIELAIALKTERAEKERERKEKLFFKSENDFLKVVNSDQRILVEESRAAVVFTEAVAGAQGEILVRDLAKLFAQNGVNIGQNRMYEWLVSKKYLECRKRWSQTKKKFENTYWQTQKAADKNIFRKVPTVINKAGIAPFEKFTLHVTCAGQTYLIGKHLKELLAV